MSPSHGELEGYRVVTPSGRLLGRVAGSTQRVIVVAMRRWGRVTLRPLPTQDALVWTRTRTVIVQVPARDLRGAPALAAAQPVDERTVARFYGLEHRAP
jgi:hypothetical protein